MNLDVRRFFRLLERFLDRRRHTITLELRTDPDFDEPAVMARLRAHGLGTDRDVVRVALWKLGLFLEVDMPPRAFELGYRPAVVTATLEEEQARLAEQASLFEDGSMTEGEAL